MVSLITHVVLVQISTLAAFQVENNPSRKVTSTELCGREFFFVISKSILLRLSVLNKT